MGIVRHNPEPTESVKLETSQALAMTDGEINFLWSFIQGSIMIPDTWGKLLRGYGFCERHAWVHLSVEMSFRHQYLLGPAILYRALLEQSRNALRGPYRIRLSTMARRLRAKGPCFLCAMNIEGGSAGVSSQARLDRARDIGELRDFAIGLRSLWRHAVCPDCAEDEHQRADAPTCRRHLLARIRTQRSIELSVQERLLESLCECSVRFENSFTANSASASDQDRAALITAVGWCSGWRPLLVLLSGVSDHSR